jgi:CheY-like chemotaxis protein
MNSNPELATERRVVLAAEDEETDAMLLRLAFQKAGVSCELFVTRDGLELVRYLNGDEAYSDRARYPLPRLILLDLKMPHMDGFDVLAWLAQRPQFKDVPAIVLTSSSHDTDIERARRLGARDFLIKPHSLGDLVQMMHDLQTRWLGVLPVARP